MGHWSYHAGRSCCLEGKVGTEHQSGCHHHVVPRYVQRQTTNDCDPTSCCEPALKGTFHQDICQQTTPFHNGSWSMETCIRKMFSLCPFSRLRIGGHQPGHQRLPRASVLCKFNTICNWYSCPLFDVVSPTFLRSIWGISTATENVFVYVRHRRLVTFVFERLINTRLLLLLLLLPRRLFPALMPCRICVMHSLPARTTKPTYCNFLLLTSAST